MKKALIGAGGFAREIKAHLKSSDMVCFVDDQYYNEESFTKPLSSFNPHEYEVLVAIGNPTHRYNIIERLPKNTKYFSFIHPSALILGDDVILGEGSIVCAGTIITTNVVIGKHAHLNLHSTVGHDCRIGDYFTTAPGAKISGNCVIGDFVYIGTNASIKEKLTVGNSVTIGSNATVVKHIDESGIYAGVPVKRIK